MQTWEHRPIVVANLLNPAFCGAIIANCAKAYMKESKRPFPYVLAFLVLPIILHKNTRKCLPKTSRKSLHEWIQENPSLKIGFADRCNQMNPFTREALMFLINQKVIQFDREGSMTIVSFCTGAMKNHDEEIEECFSKAELVGKLFAKSGSSQTVYSFWGVKP